MEVNILAAWTVVLGFLAGGFHFLILRPLGRAIKNLDDAIGELRMEFLTAEGRRHEIEKELIRIDNKAERAHERINDLEKRGAWHDLEHR